MSNDAIEISYNQDLEALEALLSKVQRPGHFFVKGSREMPMPKIEVEGVGILSFPIPVAQIKELVHQAVRAPYGRGEETILDTSVRKVWQLPPGKVHISGTSWANHFDWILSQVRDGLGCQHVLITAELYKMLVYDEGCFFLAHRDTEKTSGMFGTLVIVLPSAHQGGELVIRHAGHEVTVDLSHIGVSEMTFAAFYADCEHEVRPILNGHRVCLVYNLIQQCDAKNPKNIPLIAPLYDAEITKAAKMLETSLGRADGPIKIAWLLEHQYSPSALSFSALKNADAAIAQVLTQAAQRAGCVIHLGMVHLEESGSAEPNYDSYHSKRSKWRGYYDDDEEEGDDEYIGEDFEVIDVCDERQYIDGWVSLQNQSVHFGELPLDENELLPNGSLDEESPDEQRLMEATGNEGASYERSYHRAALVIWQQERYAEVLLQAGVAALMPYFNERIAAHKADPSDKSQQALHSLAKLILDHWETDLQSRSYYSKDQCPNRSDMLSCLSQLGDKALLERFISTILSREYDGTENVALVQAVDLLDIATASYLLSLLITANMGNTSSSCVNLLSRFVKNSADVVGSEALHTISSASVLALKEIGKSSSSAMNRSKKNTPVDSNVIVELWSILFDLKEDNLRNMAAAEISARPTIFDPSSLLVPALYQLAQLHEVAVYSDGSYVQLWKHTSQFLLNRSEYTPQPPKDWRQDIRISCSCEDCRALQTFVSEPASQVGRFRMAKERRQHLHQIIEKYNMDMTHITERKGSPHALVCTKTRKSYEARCEQYKNDILSMQTLLPLLPKELSSIAELRNRLISAIGRANT